MVMVLFGTSGGVALVMAGLIGVSNLIVPFAAQAGVGHLALGNVGSPFRSLFHSFARSPALDAP